jgi:hypothetical protein
MPALEKTTNLYTSFERITPILKANGSNLTAKAVATAVMESVVNDICDAVLAQKPQVDGVGAIGADCLDWFMADEQKNLRIAIRNRITPCITAAKNYQNVYLEPSGLMPKAVGSTDKSEFV